MATNGEILEMLFRVRMDGQADVDRLAASVRGISGDATVAATGLSSLEKAVNALTAEVSANTEALSGMEGGFHRVGTAATGAAGGVRSITSELRMMEGGMPIRAAAQFIAQMEGLRTVMSLAFPIFGAIALVGVLDTILGKAGLMPGQWDETTKAQQKSYEKLDSLGKKYDELIAKSKKLADQEYEHEHGKEAGRLHKAGEGVQSIGADEQQIMLLRSQIDVLRKLSGSNYVPNASDAFLANTAGMANADSTGLWGLKNSSVQAGVFNDTSQEKAKQLLPILEAQLRNAQVERQNDSTETQIEYSKVGEDKRKQIDEEAKKRKQELATAEKQAAAYLREAMTFELTGLDKINEKYREKLELLGKTPKAIADIRAAYVMEVERETAKEVHEGAMKLDKLRGKWQSEVESGHATYDEASGAYYVTPKTPKKLQLTGYSENQEKQDGKDVDAALKVLRAGDDTDADAARRMLGITTKGNDLAVSSGRMSGQSGASADYTARVAAAKDIFDIETRHLDLIVEQDKRDEAYATARKKREAEIYRAAEQYENQIQALREQDLKKYESMAGSIFDALHGRTMNQWIKGLALGQVKQVFENVAAPVLQTAGHVLGSVMPSSMGGILHGTLLDPANKGVSDASTTAKQTTRTADEVVKLRDDMRKLLGASGGSTTGEAGLPDIANLPMSGTNGSTPASILFGNGGLLGTGTVPGAGSASTLFNAGNGSGFGQFLSGLGGAGSNPLGAIFTGMSTNGSTVTQLTAAQQAGAAVGTAAMLAGAGLSIASGIGQGGIGGISKAVGAGAGAAAMLDPEPVSKTILTAVAAVTSIVGSLFGSSPQKRANDIFNELSKNQYLAPTALNVTQGMNGTYEDFDGRGNLRTSTMSAVPTVAEPYITSRVQDGQRTYYDVPGQVTSPYSGGATGTGQAPIAGGVVVNIANMHAMDSASFGEFIRRPANAHQVGESMADHLERHDGRAANAIRFISGQ